MDQKEISDDAIAKGNNKMSSVLEEYSSDNTVVRTGFQGMTGVFLPVMQTLRKT